MKREPVTRRLEPDAAWSTTEDCERHWQERSPRDWQSYLAQMRLERERREIRLVAFLGAMWAIFFCGLFTIAWWPS